MSIPKLVRTLPRPTFLKSKLIFSNRNSSPFLITVHLLVQKWTNGFFQPLLWDGPTWFSKSNKVSIVISCLDHQLLQQNNHQRHIIMIIRIIKNYIILTGASSFSSKGHTTVSITTWVRITATGELTFQHHQRQRTDTWRHVATRD